MLKLVLFQAETYVALYVLGNIRDGRLKQMLQVVVHCTALLIIVTIAKRLLHAEL